MPEISVLIPSYNHAPFIGRTLHSVFRQTLQPKKLLVIDDGSKDNSVEIIEKTLKDCPFENEFIARENRGLCATLNEGFAKTEGEFFTYIGSDDVWLPAFLEKRVRLLEKKPDSVLAFGHSFLIDENDLIIDSTADWLEYVDGNMQRHLLRGLHFAAPSVIYRRSAVAKYGWNEDAKLEDYELYLKLSSEGDFAFDSTVLCGWRQHQSNTSKDLPLMFDEWIKAQNRVAGLLKVSAEELEKIQMELKFNAAVNFARHGYKREAISLFWNNKNAAGSLVKLGNTFVRLLIPKSLYAFYQRKNREKYIRRYGKLEI